MFVPVGINDELTLRIPQFFCCNCGSAQDIRSASTELTDPDRGLLDGTPMAISLDLPYCRRCIRTAQREPVGLPKKLLVATVMALTTGVLAMLVPRSGLPDVISGNIFFVAAAIAFALVLGLYSLQRPVGGQTSYSQPVRLQKIDREVSGAVVGLTLAFTHARYAQVFAHANREAVQRAALRVVELLPGERR